MNGRLTCRRLPVTTRHGRDISRGIISRQKSGRDRDRGGLPDFSRNRDRDRGGLSKKSGRGHRDFIREESRQVGIIREVGGKRDYLDFPRKSRVIPTLP